MTQSQAGGSSAANDGPKCIVVAVDFSEFSERALTWAFRIAEACGAKLHAVHSVALLAAALREDAHPEAPDFEERVNDEADRRLEALANVAKAAGHELQVHRIDRNPAEGIVEEAEKLGADLIVMGTHGRSGLDRLMLGSVADRVLRTSHIPVLTVR